ncbi:MAG: hypothetical protein F4X67_12545, partial [Gemmatimonadales bacterium]|nr:hypothetical protein [Gemmatimonadales bacterium]
MAVGSLLHARDLPPLHRARGHFRPRLQALVGVGQVVDGLKLRRRAVRVRRPAFVRGAAARGDGRGGGGGAGWWGGAGCGGEAGAGWGGLGGGGA